MGTTEDTAIRLYTMADDPAAAMSARWCKGLDCAFEAVEDVHRSSGSYLKRLVVVVPADLTDRHLLLLP
jgi:hypothetical protein